MSKAPRFHRVNPAMVAHNVPFAGCENAVFWLIFGVAFTPAVGTGFQNVKVDIFAVAFFLPLWGLARLMYLRDPRSFRKFVDHLSWVYDIYVARRRLGSTSERRQPSVMKRIVRVITRFVTP